MDSLDNICSICLLEYTDNKCITDCNHYFCESCLEGWINKQKISCPICRHDITFFKNNTTTTKLIHIISQPTRNRPHINRNIVVFNRKTYFILNIILTFSIMTSCIMTALWADCKKLYDFP